MNCGKTLLLLGGSRQQVVAIEAAKKCGYRTVLCDYLPDNPGQYVADVFYQESTTDRDAVLGIAKKEGVGGIIAYASDPAAPTAAFVAEKLGLPTNPLASVEILSEKHRFRDFLHEAGLPCPKAFSFSADFDPKYVEDALAGFNFPIVIKPTDSSGSKGVTVLHCLDSLEDAIAYATRSSRNRILIAEEYISRVFPHVVGGDVFVLDGKVVLWGLMSCLRDEASPLVPVGEKTPSGLSGQQLANCKAVIQNLVNALEIRFGELNVEVLIGEDDIPYILELGARAGGNMIPVQLSDVSGIDLVRANVMCAMGDDPGDLFWEPDGDCFAHYVLHSQSKGLFQGVELSDAANAACYRRVLYQEQGAPVEEFTGANKALGILFFRFDSEANMTAFFGDISNHVKVLVSH